MSLCEASHSYCNMKITWRAVWFSRTTWTAVSIDERHVMFAIWILTLILQVQYHLQLSLNFFFNCLQREGWATVFVHSIDFVKRIDIRSQMLTIIWVKRTLSMIFMFSIKCSSNLSLPSSFLSLKRLLIKSGQYQRELQCHWLFHFHISSWDYSSKKHACSLWHFVV